MIKTTTTLSTVQPSNIAKRGKMASYQTPFASTTTACVIATAIISGVTGYFIGQGVSLGLFSTRSSSTKNLPKRKESDEDDESEQEDESEDEDDGELATFNDNTEEVKLVLVVRTDLGMNKGVFFFFFFFFFFAPRPFNTRLT